MIDHLLIVALAVELEVNLTANTYINNKLTIGKICHKRAIGIQSFIQIRKVFDFKIFWKRTWQDILEGEFMNFRFLCCCFLNLK